VIVEDIASDPLGQLPRIALPRIAGGVAADLRRGQRSSSFALYFKSRRPSEFDRELIAMVTHCAANRGHQAPEQLR
jgi:hypothetical protein